MSNDEHNNIPTLEVPTLDEVIQHGDSKTEKLPNKKIVNKAQPPAAQAPKPKDRRKTDRRKKETGLAEGQNERRIEQRRSNTSRPTDNRREKELNLLVEKIMQDLMPDLEQHLFLQLRFELQKHLPQTLSEFKDKDDE